MEGVLIESNKIKSMEILAGALPGLKTLHPPDKSRWFCASRYILDKQELPRPVML